MEPRKVVEAWVSAFNSADADLISKYYTDNTINHQIANREVVGKEAIRSMFQEEFTAAKMVCIVEHIFQDGNWAILEWKDQISKRLLGQAFISRTTRTSDSQ